MPAPSWMSVPLHLCCLQMSARHSLLSASGDKITYKTNMEVFTFLRWAWLAWNSHRYPLPPMFWELKVCATTTSHA